MRKLAMVIIALLGMLIVPTAPVQAFGGGSFFVTCHFVKAQQIDPLTGDDPSGHLHMFFGNLSIQANSTVSSLLSGGTNCSNPNDKSSYWAPTFTKSGKMLTPTQVNVYYVSSASHTNPFPNGFKAKSYDVTFSCGGGTSKVPRDCGGGHPQYNVRFFGGGFPDTHVQYKFDDIHSLVGAALSSDGQVPPHGDIFVAWSNDRLTELVNSCLNAHKTCGRVKT